MHVVVSGGQTFVSMTNGLASWHRWHTVPVTRLMKERFLQCQSNGEIAREGLMPREDDEAPGIATGTTTCGIGDVANKLGM